MLVLSRKVNERINIGETIILTIVDIGHGKVKIGIEAPTDMPVDRAEVRVEKLARMSKEVE